MHVMYWYHLYTSGYCTLAKLLPAAIEVACEMIAVIMYLYARTIIVCH